MSMFSDFFSLAIGPFVSNDLEGDPQNVGLALEDIAIDKPLNEGGSLYLGISHSQYFTQKDWEHLFFTRFSIRQPVKKSEFFFRTYMGCGSRLENLFSGDEKKMDHDFICGAGFQGDLPVYGAFRIVLGEQAVMGDDHSPLTQGVFYGLVRYDF